MYLRACMQAYWAECTQVHSEGLVVAWGISGTSGLEIPWLFDPKL